MDDSERMLEEVGQHATGLHSGESSSEQRRGHEQWLVQWCSSATTWRQLPALLRALSSNTSSSNNISHVAVFVAQAAERSCRGSRDEQWRRGCCRALLDCANNNSNNNVNVKIVDCLRSAAVGCHVSAASEDALSRGDCAVLCAALHRAPQLLPTAQAAALRSLIIARLPPPPPADPSSSSSSSSWRSWLSLLAAAGGPLSPSHLQLLWSLLSSPDISPPVRAAALECLCEAPQHVAPARLARELRRSSVGCAEPLLRLACLVSWSPTDDDGPELLGALQHTASAHLSHPCRVHSLACSALHSQLQRFAAMRLLGTANVPPDVWPALLRLTDVRALVAPLAAAQSLGGLALLAAACSDDEADDDEDYDMAGAATRAAVADDGNNADAELDDAAESSWKRVQKFVERRLTDVSYLKPEWKPLNRFDRSLERVCDVIGCAAECWPEYGEWVGNMCGQSVNACCNAQPAELASPNGAALMLDAGTWLMLFQRCMDIVPPKVVAQLHALCCTLQEKLSHLLRGTGMQGAPQRIWKLLFRLETQVYVALQALLERWETQPDAPALYRSLDVANGDAMLGLLPAIRYASRMYQALRHVITPQLLPAKWCGHPLLLVGRLAVQLHAGVIPPSQAFTNAVQGGASGRLCLAAYVCWQLRDCKRALLQRLITLLLRDIPWSREVLLDPDVELQSLSALQCLAQCLPQDMDETVVRVAEMANQAVMTLSAATLARVVGLCATAAQGRQTAVAAHLQLLQRASALANTAEGGAAADLWTQCVALSASLLEYHWPHISSLHVGDRRQLIVGIILSCCAAPQLSLQRAALATFVRIARRQASVLEDSAALHNAQTGAVVDRLLRHVMAQDVPHTELAIRVAHLLALHVDWAYVTVPLSALPLTLPKQLAHRSDDLFAFQKTLTEHLHDVRVMSL